MTPQEPKGEQVSADAGVQIAIRLLEHSLVAHGSTSDKGAVIAKVLPMLAKAFGKSEDQAQAIMPAELKSALMSPAGEAGAAPSGGGAPAGAGAPAAAAA